MNIINNLSGKSDSQIKVSRFTRMLWWIAGADNIILIKCRTDYQRFASIGMTILLTAMAAVGSGTWAAWYFDAGYYSLLFGFFWGVLILSIDRSLVVTLQKKPREEGEKRYKINGRQFLTFLIRFILAGLIAFIISIPFELKFFEDKIVEQRDRDNTELKESKHGSLDFEYGITTDSIAASQAQTKSKEAKENADNPANNPEYIRIKTEISNQNLETKEKRKNEVKAEAARLNKQIKYYPENHENPSLQGKPIENDDFRRYKEYTKKNSYYQTAITEYNEALAAVRTLTTKLDNERERYKNEQNDEAKRMKILQDSIDKVRTRNESTLREEMKKYKEDVLKEGSKSFIRDFTALENAAKKDNSLSLLLWLFRLMLFVIELLPTVVKMVTPMGNYDRRVYQEEHELEEYLKSENYKTGLQKNFERKITHKKDIQELKYKMEKDCAEQQTKIAQEAILAVTKELAERWKNKSIKNDEI